MERPSGTHEREQKFQQLLGRKKLKETDCLEEEGMGERVVLKWILSTMGGCALY